MTRMGRTIRPALLNGWFLLAGYGALCVAPPARAEPYGPGRNAAQAAEATLPVQLDEIVVTARRLPELLQETPVSVAALSDRDASARSLTNLRDLQNFVPNLTFAPSQNVGEAAANVFIRGIGQEDFVPGSEPGVGIYLDGIYLARSVGALANLVDVARIEVLRGPQGTLYGRNTIGGAINLVSQMPQARASGSGRLVLGSFDRAERRVVINRPLSGNLLARLSLGAFSRGGYLRRLPPLPALLAFGPAESGAEGDDRSQAARLQVRWLMTARLTLDVSLDASRRRNRQSATHLDAIDPRIGIFRDLNRLIREGRLPGPELSDAIRPASLLESYASGESSTRQDIRGASAVLSAMFAGAEMKFIGGWRSLRSRVRTDIDGLYFDINRGAFSESEHQWTAELQVSGSPGRLTYTAGLFAFAERARRIPEDGALPNFIRATCACQFSPANLPRTTEADLRFGSTSLAAYLQAGYKLTDRLIASSGARFTHERKSLEARLLRLDPEMRLTDALVASGTNRGEWNPLTWRAGLDWRATPGLMVYGSAARGFKSGGFNSRATETLPNLGLTAFRPETAMTYEIGLRSQWLGRRLHLNATLFRTDYRDIQLRQQTIIGTQVATLIENAALGRIRGVEADLTVIPAAGLSVSLAYGYLDARYLKVERVPGVTLASRFQRTPGHSASGSFEYTRKAAWGEFELHGDMSYRSSEQFQIVASPFDQKGYALLGARITFRPARLPWSFALFGTNLSDARYRVSGRDLVSQVGWAYSNIGPPRQWGLEVRTGF